MVRASYRYNFYRTGKIGDKFLVTTDSGSWVLLGRDAYEALSSGSVLKDPLLYDVLCKKHIILTDFNTERYVRELEKKYSYLFSGPSLHIVAITGKCNNRCVYCHANAVPEGHGCGKKEEPDMTAETARKTVDFIFQSPSSNIAIEFQGGEPLLNFPVLKYVVEYAKEKNRTVKKNLKFSLVTNLAAMDKEKLDFIMKHKIGLCTSLDGPKQVHDTNRRSVGGPGTYEPVARWVKKIKHDHKYPLEALMVTTRASLNHPREIIDEYIGLGFDNIQLRPLSILGYAKDNLESIGYSAEEYIEFWKAAMDHIIDINILSMKQGGKKLFYDRFSRYIITKFFSAKGPNFVDLGSPCGAAVSTLAFDHKGDIFTCDEGRQYDEFRLGDVGKTFREVYSSPQAAGIIGLSTNDVLICDACVWKPFCGICPVCNYAETGNALPLLSKNNRCRILKAQFSYLMEKMQDPAVLNIFRGWLKTG